MRVVPRHVWGPVVRGTATVKMPDRTWTIDVDRRTCAVCGTVEESFADCGFEEGSSSDACWAALKHVQCVRCGHEPCEGCMDWCDRLVYEGSEDVATCCDGKCLYPGDPAPSGVEGLAAEEQRANAADGATHDLMEDLVAIMTSFAARLYGQRRGRAKTNAAIAAMEAAQ